MAAINILWISLACIGSYLVGSIPFSVWIGKLALGKDVRNYGTQNPGGFNALRTFGPKIGFPILFLDQFKGIITIALMDHIFNLPYFESGNGFNYYHLIMCCVGPFICIMGHNYSIWLKFKGGQGMGIMMGVFFYVNPILLLFFLSVYAILYAGLKVPTRTTGMIVSPLCIPAALFLPIGPPWANILMVWTVGTPDFPFVAQGLVIAVTIISFLLKKAIDTIIGVEVIVEKVLEEN
ncbi:MAG: glycerol-3-phosphate acyltransferase [Candidatus Thorarchaeota archaeon]